MNLKLIFQVILALPEIFKAIRQLFTMVGDLKDDAKADNAKTKIEENHKAMLDGARPKWD